MSDATIFWLIFGAVLVWLAASRLRPRPQTFRYRGETFVRRPDGSFATMAGVAITGALLIGALAAAYEAERQRHDSSDTSGGDSHSSGGGWFDGGGADSSGGDSGGGGGDGGGGD